MSHFGPVMIFLIDPSEVPSQLSSWEDAASLISARWDRWEKGEDADFVTSASRNWWHQHLLALLRRTFAIEGLEFTVREVSCLEKEEIRVAAQGLDELFRLVEAGRLLEKPDIYGDEYLDIFREDSVAAFHQARAMSEIKPYDAGFGAVVSFFAFLKSLRSVLLQAYRLDRPLLYVMPDFDGAGD